VAATPRPQSAAPSAGTDSLTQEAIGVLRGNDQGTWTRPSPQLYPHQWSWDAGFVAMGWATIDPARAIDELRSLFRGQWATGMVPHIVFDPSVPDGEYEPGPEAWATVGHAPPGVATSAICQPPIHAIALARIRETTLVGGDDAATGSGALVDAAIAELYPQLAAWHRWLHTARDLDHTGLVTLLHPWESGMDNSPRWDGPLAAVRPDDRPTLARPDLRHVASGGERPTDDEYRRYWHLVEELKAVDHDQAAAVRRQSFRVADVWFSAILAAADHALAELATVAGHPEAAEQHCSDAAHTRTALDACWDLSLGRALDVDRVSGTPIAADTIAGFAPLVAGSDVDRTAVLIDRLFGETYAGASGLAHAVPPTTAVDSPAFDRRAYWRGPQWAPMTWLLWWSLDRAGHHRAAARLRTSALDQLRATGCCEYVDPYDDTPLGSRAQSWTAAVALDWLAHGR
jgi:hypothetical protein